MEQITLRPDVGRHYSEDDARVINELALRLKRRDGFIQPSVNLHPKHYMTLYARAAAALFEMAKSLSTFDAPGLPRRGIGDWIVVLSGIHVHFPTTLHFDEATDAKTNVLDIQGSPRPDR